MSVKHSILAILASGPSFGYQLKKEFEELTVGIWPINDGQIYTTLARVARVRSSRPGAEARPRRRRSTRRRSRGAR